MLARKICFASLTLALAWIVSCSSDKAAPGRATPEGGGVGSKCQASSECTGYSKPTCLTELKPVEGLVSPDAAPSAQAFATLTLPFPGGYCSNTLADSCQSDSDWERGAAVIVLSTEWIRPSSIGWGRTCRSTFMRSRTRACA